MKAALFEKLVSHPPKAIDVMLMEGSSFGRLESKCQRNCIMSIKPTV